MIFRFDAITGNTDFTLLYEKIDFLKSKIDCSIWIAYSPLSNSTGEQRPYPLKFDELNDHRNYYSVDICKPHRLKRDGIEMVSHGLFYVDYRQLSYDVQEAFILSGRYLTKSKRFVPPFNKWNNDTEKICKNYLIHLVKSEDGWANFDRSEFNQNQTRWFTKNYPDDLEVFKRKVSDGLQLQ
jgi:hypothetical protein